MTRKNINIGSSANDGTGDTLRTAGSKINQNFQEIYTQLGGDSSSLTTQVILKDSGGVGAIIFEGTSADSHETKLIASNVGADTTITLPDSAGTIITNIANQTLTNKTLTAPIISSISNTGTITLPTSTDTLVGRATTDTLTNKTLTSPTINTPKIGTSLNDANGNEFIKFTTTGSAVNEITIANGASTTGPALSATGGGANLNISLTPKGKGSVSVAKAAYGSNTMDSDGQVDSSASLIICNKGSALAAALGAGTTVGEFKIFTNKGAGLATVTPHPFANGTSFSLTQNKAAQCIWDGANWFLLTTDSSAAGLTITA